MKTVVINCIKLIILCLKQEQVAIGVRDHTCCHGIFAIFRHPDALRCLFELEVLDQLNAVLVDFIVLEGAPPLPGQPVRKGARIVGTRDGVDRNIVLLGDFEGHGGSDRRKSGG